MLNTASCILTTKTWVNERAQVLQHSKTFFSAGVTHGFNKCQIFTDIPKV